jgi:RNA polymerase sigma-70 factor (ECF subfamily)
VKNYIQNTIHQEIEQIYHADSRRIFASLVRLLRDFDLAEEAMHEAFTLAVTQWAESGIPENPRACMNGQSNWLARNRSVDFSALGC